MKKVIFLLFLALVIVIISCRKDDGIINLNSEPEITVNNDPILLNRRLVQKSERVNVNYLSSGRVTEEIALTLVAEIDPPSINDEEVMATSVSIENDLVAISYNTASDAYGGAVVTLDMDQDSFEIQSEVTFSGHDVSHAIVADGTVYIAGASEIDLDAAWIGKFDLDGSTINEASFLERSLYGHVATSLSTSGDAVFVTTGSGSDTESGVFKVATETLDILTNYPLEDARWCQYEHEQLWVQNGSPGGMQLYDSDLALSKSFATSNADVESKATFDLVSDYLFAGVGRNGVEIYDEEGILTDHIPVPEGNDFTTNSVAVYGDLIFISNGAKIHVATYSDEQEVNPEIIGELELGEYASVNHVAFKENFLIIASGLGGVKIVELDFDSEAPAVGELLSKEEMSIVYFDSEETGRERYATNLLDDNLNTLWHTEWMRSDPPYPHEVWVDLGNTYTLTEFRYRARQIGNFNGTVASFELYISDNTDNWGEAAYSGTFVKTRDEQVASFEGATGRYVRFLALSEVNGQPWASGSELNFVGY